MIQTVIFDMDGVIVDTEPVHKYAYHQHFNQLGITVTPEMYASFTGNSTKNIFERLKVQFNLEDQVQEQSGIDALAAIKARFPDLPVLVLSGFPESHYATTLLRQGASGYLNKECDPEEIATAIRTVYRGRKYISPAVAELLADGLSGDGDKPAHDQLSERELQVFLRLAKGETIGNMAKAMFLSVKTVSTYRTRVLEKLKLSSNSDLTYYALTNGLIQ